MGELDKVTVLEAREGRKSYLFYGPPASGKTTEALKLMALSKSDSLLIDVDEKGHEMEMLIKQLACPRIKVWQPQEPLTGESIIIARSPDAANPKIGEKIEFEPKGLRRTVTLVNELLALARKPEPFPYDFVTLDSWSRTCDHVIRKCMFDHGVAFMTQRLWGVITTTLTNVLSGFLQLPCNRIIIAHERHRIIRDQATDTIKREDIRPASIGQTSDTMGREFSEIWYFKGKNRSSNTYQIQTVGDGLLYARNSRGLADFCDINPDGSLSPTKPR